MRCLFLEFKDAPIQEADRLRNPAKGRATGFLLNWFGLFFFFLVYGNDCGLCSSMQCGWPFFQECDPQQGAEKSPCLQQAPLHPQLPLRFGLAGKGPSLAPCCLAQSLSLKSGSTTHFCVLAFCNSTSMRKTIFRTLSSPHQRHESSCQKLAYG